MSLLYCSVWFLDGLYRLAMVDMSFIEIIQALDG
jgi:hypothetical protein